MTAPYIGPLTAEDQIAWMKAHQEYRRLRALTDADEAFGPTARSDHDLELARLGAEMQSGSLDRARRNPEVARLLDKLFQADEAASERQMQEFIRPMDRAAISLVVLPAPTLDAAIEKIAIVKREHLDNHADFPGEPFDFIAADLARFAPGGGA